MITEGKYSEEQLTVLDELGFQEYDPQNENHMHQEIMKDMGGRLFIEEHFCRQRVFVRLDEQDDNYFDVYVLEDIGCDAIRMPFHWAELSADWLTHFKMSLALHGFMKDGQEVKLNNLTT